MSLTVAQIYSVRFGTKLSLPRIVQDNIAKLRITAAAYKPTRPHHKSHHKSHSKHGFDNWRVKSISSFVTRIRDNDDVDYNDVFMNLNKVSASNLDVCSSEIAERISKRDQEFRLRVSTLLFNKAISESVFANVMADCAVKLNTVHPDIKDDLILQANMFPTLYDINTTLAFPSSEDPEYEDKVVGWMKQKDKRRGYAKFLTQLYVRDLITEAIMVKSLEQVITEMKLISKQPKSETTEENVTQFVDFLFESAKMLVSRTGPVKDLIRTSLKELTAIPRTELPSLGMRSRFRLEDTLKCVQ
jgi:hypothetical protein